MSQLLAATLADGRLQLWFIDTFGKLISRSQTSVGVDAKWTDWTDFPKPSTSGLKSITAGPLPQDSRLQLWAVDEMNDFWSALQVSTDINAGWTNWAKLPSPEPAASVEAIAAAPLEDGRLQLSAVLTFTDTWVTRMVSTDISAGWTNWTKL